MMVIPICSRRGEGVRIIMEGMGGIATGVPSCLMSILLASIRASTENCYKYSVWQDVGAPMKAHRELGWTGSVMECEGWRTEREDTSLLKTGTFMSTQNVPGMVTSWGRGSAVPFGGTIAGYGSNYAPIEAPGAKFSRVQINPPATYDMASHMTGMYCLGDGTVINVQMEPW